MFTCYIFLKRFSVISYLHYTFNGFYIILSFPQSFRKFGINFNFSPASNFLHKNCNIHLWGTIKHLVWRTEYQAFMCFLWYQRVARLRNAGNCSTFSILCMTQTTIRKRTWLCFRKIILKNNGSGFVPCIKIRKSSV
jgi:hypothetical protein